MKFSHRGILKFTGKTPGFKIPPLRNFKISCPKISRRRISKPRLHR
nr:hypothetical protein [uncultured Campylobacter sp.]